MAQQKKTPDHYFHVLEVLLKATVSRNRRLVIRQARRSEISVPKSYRPRWKDQYQRLPPGIAHRRCSAPPFARIQMSPRFQSSQPLLPFRDIVSKAMGLPHELQRGDYIEVKLKANWRSFDKALREARALWRSASAAIVVWLHKAGMRNAREVANLLVHLEDLDCDNSLLRCLANGEYDSGHEVMDVVSRRGELCELLRHERVASLVLKAIADDCACANSFLSKRWIQLDRRARLLLSVLANARP